MVVGTAPEKRAELSHARDAVKTRGWRFLHVGSTRREDERARDWTAQWGPQVSTPTRACEADGAGPPVGACDRSLGRAG
jgi:hypothetical protein